MSSTETWETGKNWCECVCVCMYNNFDSKKGNHFFPHVLTTTESFGALMISGTLVHEPNLFYDFEKDDYICVCQGKMAVVAC